jgi:cytosine/adenosine deaminase-related metal-dependent hydrolase
MIKALRARYVFPVDRPPIEDGVVTLDDDRIIDVGRYAGDPAIDLGDVAIIPGLINAHTHLEFSNLDQPLGEPGMPLPVWIREVIRRRAAATAEQSPSAIDPIQAGLAESRRYGVTTSADIVTDPTRRLAESSAGVEFLELRAMRRSNVDACLDSAERWLSSPGSGLSPHAPYTVHWHLLHAAVEMARHKQAPLAMHLAESPEELELLNSASGPFRELLEDRGWWEPNALPPKISPLAYLQELAKAERALVIHGNYLNDEEIKFLAEHRTRIAVVYCPRTHAYFGHDPYPLQTMLDCGVRLALGTDSRASNPDLDLLAEMRFVADRHHTPPVTALRLGTIEGALALGLSANGGTITPGKLADLAVLKLPAAQAADPHELLFTGDTRTIATVWRGCIVHSTHPNLSVDAAYIPTGGNW